jgi:hypothetical protein
VFHDAGHPTADQHRPALGNTSTDIKRDIAE